MSNGVFYAVNYKNGGDNEPGSWISFDIENDGPWKVDYEILKIPSGDGLVYIEQIDTFITDDFVNGTLLSYSPSYGDYKFNVITEQMLLHEPADMAYNAEDKIVAIAQLSDGMVYFFKVDIITTTTFYSTMDNTKPADNACKMSFMLAFCISIAITLFFQ